MGPYFLNFRIDAPQTKVASGSAEAPQIRFNPSIKRKPKFATFQKVKRPKTTLLYTLNERSHVMLRTAI